MDFKGSLSIGFPGTTINAHMVIHKAHEKIAFDPSITTIFPTISSRSKGRYDPIYLYEGQDRHKNLELELNTNGIKLSTKDAVDEQTFFETARATIPKIHGYTHELWGVSRPTLKRYFTYDSTEVLKDSDMIPKFINTISESEHWETILRYNKKTGSDLGIIKTELNIYSGFAPLVISCSVTYWLSDNEGVILTIDSDKFFNGNNPIFESLLTGGNGNIKTILKGIVNDG